jgi:hypothetical protein
VSTMGAQQPGAWTAAGVFYPCENARLEPFWAKSRLGAWSLEPTSLAPGAWSLESGAWIRQAWSLEPGAWAAAGVFYPCENARLEPFGAKSRAGAWSLAPGADQPGAWSLEPTSLEPGAWGLDRA